MLHVHQACDTHRERLLKIPSVVAVGVGYKQVRGVRTSTPSVICSVVKKVSRHELSRKHIIPQDLDGTRTDVIETGKIRALALRTDRFRPAPGGVSIGHRDITAGTLGCIVRRDGVRLILSNNHVLANSNGGKVGDPIVQPGPYDGGKVAADTIGTLDTFVPITFLGEPTPCKFARAINAAFNAAAWMIGSKTRYTAVRIQAVNNLVDCALAVPVADSDVSDEIFNIGRILGWTTGELGMPLRKSGRTTGVTTDEVRQVNVTVDVEYGAGQVARFEDQIMAGAMSQGGDSGSAVLNGEDQIVGLLFAGSDNTTIINRIEQVFSALKVGL